MRSLFLSGNLLVHLCVICSAPVGTVCSQQRSLRFAFVHMETADKQKDHVTIHVKMMLQFTAAHPTSGHSHRLTHKSWF